VADTPTMEVRARLTADSAQFVQGMNNATAAANQLTSTASRVNSAMTGISIAAGIGMGGLVALAVQSFNAAARVEELNYAMDAVGKATHIGFARMEEAALGIKSMGIEMNVAQRSALMFAQNNLDLAKASEVARVAQDLAVLSGKNSTEEFQLLTYAIMTQRSELFKSAGINASVQGAYEKMAQSLGKSTKELTAGEKVQAAMNMVLEEGKNVAGTYESAMKSASKVLRSMPRLMEDFHVALGDTMLKGIGPMIVSFYNMLKAIIKAAEGTGAFKSILNALTAVFVYITTPLVKFMDGMKGFVERLDSAKINTEALAQKLNAVLPILLAVGSAFATAGGAALFKMVPVLGTVLGMLNPVAVGFAVLALTSTRVREAFVNLGKAFLPVVGIMKQVAQTILGVLGYAVGAIAIAINGLARVVTGIIGFIQRFASAFKMLATFVGIAALAVGAYKVTLMAITAWQAIAAGASLAWGVALDIMAGMALIAEAATGGLTAATAAFMAVLEVNPIALAVAAIIALVAAIVYLYNANETARQIITTVFNNIVQVIGTVISSVISWIGQFLLAIGSTIETHRTLAKIVGLVFKSIAEVIAGAINIVLQSYANQLKGIATLIHWFGVAKDFIGEVWGKIVQVIATAAGFVANIVKDIANNTIGAFVNFVRDKVAGLIGWLANAAGKIPGIGGKVAGFLNDLQDAVKGTTDSVKAFDDSATKAFSETASKNAVKSIDAITSIGNVLAKATQSWGNYSTGVEGTLSNVANAMSKTGQTIVNFAGNIDSLKVIDAIGNGATVAGNYLVGIAEGIKSMTSGDVLGNLIGGVKDLVANLKETVGFGDILKTLESKFQGSPFDPNKDDPNALGQNTAKDIKGKADQMQKIRDAMRAGLDAISKVMDDLRQAAADFAKSLKETIVGFAGLRGVELPDGFIPQAKSLIENMQMKLNKATQFSSQIAQLQAMNLDAGALKEIIEAGPVQGAQLAAAILGGGQEAVDQVSSLQKAIEFAGAAIGQQGVVAAGYPAMIANAQTKYDSIAAAQLAVGGSGTTVNVSEGAFKISVDTKDATTAEEATQMITDAIQAAFATLGKELAAK
jgi:hypothetical protein